jgi:hypothetical protein
MNTVSEKVTAKSTFWGAMYAPDKNTIWVGRSDHKCRAFVAPHKYGFMLILQDGLSRFDRGKEPRRFKGSPTHKYLIPGNYRIDEVVAAVCELTSGRAYNVARPITTKTGKDLTIKSPEDWQRRRRIKKILQDSGLWESRGRVPWLTPEFTKFIPPIEFVKGGFRSKQYWWTTYLTRRTRMNVQRRQDNTLLQSTKAYWVHYRQTRSLIERGIYASTLDKYIETVKAKYAGVHSLYGGIRPPSSKQLTAYRHSYFHSEMLHLGQFSLQQIYLLPCLHFLYDDGDTNLNPTGHINPSSPIEENSWQDVF